MADSDAPAIPPSTALAVDRTRLAHDRTLLAWVRTATSLISFGFTIYKFFEYLQKEKPGFGQGKWLGPREFALLMISTGLAALLIATFQHRRDQVLMRRHYPDTPYSLATILAFLLLVVGIASLVTVIMRQ